MLYKSLGFLKFITCITASPLGEEGCGQQAGLNSEGTYLKSHNFIRAWLRAAECLDSHLALAQYNLSGWMLTFTKQRDTVAEWRKSTNL